MSTQQEDFTPARLLAIRDAVAKRKGHDVSQTMFADMIGTSGRTVSRYETGESSPVGIAVLKKLNRLAKEYGV